MDLLSLFLTVIFPTLLGVGSGPALAGAQLICRSQGNLQFSQKFPRERHDLTFCHEYSRLTCCNRTHTQQILRSVHPLYSNTDFNGDCRDLSVSISCSPCDSSVGTGGKTGVCESLCDKWYKACHNDFFFYDSVENILKPCADDSLVCSRVHDMASSGSDFCEKSGFEVTRSTKGCFDGKKTYVPLPEPPFWKQVLSQWKRMKRRMNPVLALAIEVCVSATIPLLLIMILWGCTSGRHETKELSEAELREKRLMKFARDMNVPLDGSLNLSHDVLSSNPQHEHQNFAQNSSQSIFASDLNNSSEILRSDDNNLAREINDVQERTSMLSENVGESVDENESENGAHMSMPQSVEPLPAWGSNKS